MEILEYQFLVIKNNGLQGLEYSYKAVVPGKRLVGAQFLVKINRIFGDSAPSSEHILDWMNPLPSNVSYPIFKALYQLSMKKRECKVCVN